MSDILISLLIAAGFAGAWSALYQLGGLDWLLDARMASARRMLTASKFAFDGEVHAVTAQPAALSTTPVSVKAAATSPVIITQRAIPARAQARTIAHA